MLYNGSTGVPAIPKHLNNIFESKELDKYSVISILETTATETRRESTPSPDKGRAGVGLVDKYAYTTTFDEIKENDFNLNIPRYVDTFEEEQEIDLMAVRQERETLKSKLAELEVEMDGYLKELGYAS